MNQHNFILDNLAPPPYQCINGGSFPPNFHTFPPVSIFKSKLKKSKKGKIWSDSKSSMTSPQGLRSADWSLFGGKSDPYCIVGTSKCDLNALQRKWLEIREVFRYFSLFCFFRTIFCWLFDKNPVIKNTHNNSWNPTWQSCFFVALKG